MGKFTLKKSLKRYTANVLNFLLLFSLIVPNVLSPAIVIAQDLDIAQNDAAVETVIDESEDILEDGINTSILEEDTPESSFENGIYTVNTVSLGEYVYPDNPLVKVNFTEITQEGNLVIERVILTQEQKVELNTTEDYAWDITSSMNNGSFKYDLTLPNSLGNDVEVKYSEDGSTYESVEGTNTNSNIIELKGLNHFTIFVVVSPKPVNSNCSDAGFPISSSSDKCYNTIQEAVTNAIPGETIIVKPGTYTENNIIVDKENLTIKSSDGATLTIIDGSNVNDPIFKVTKNNVTIEGFTVKNGGSIDYGAVYINDATGTKILKNTFSDNEGDLYIEGGSATVFKENILVGENTSLDAWAILISNSSDNKLKNNSISKKYSTYSAIDIQNSNNNEISDNTLNENNKDNTNSSYYPTISLSASNGNTIADNKVINNQNPGGISLSNSSNENLVSGNEIINNNDKESLITPGIIYGYGILLQSSKLNVVSGNTVKKQNSGIRLVGGSDSRIEKNILTENYNGINFYNANGYKCENNIVQYNEIFSNTYRGIYFQGMPGEYSNYSTTISHNNIYNNTKGIYYDGNDTLDATLNWWGHHTGPSGEASGLGDKVSENILYQEWLCEPYSTEWISENGICRLQAPETLGWNVSSLAADPGQTPPALSCGSYTNDNTPSHVWTGIEGENIKYQRQAKTPTGGWWTDPMAYTDTNTPFGWFGNQTNGIEGEWNTRVRAWVDTNENGILDNTDLTSDWSNECKITYDKTAPEKPAGLERRGLDSTIYQCGDIAQLQTLIPDWDDNTEADFSHYEYTSFHPNGSIGINEQKLNSSEFLHNWVPATEGIYGYAVRAVDLAGNKSAWSLSGKTLEGSCQITYDSTGPVAPSIVFPSEGQYFNSTPILNDWTDVSDPSGIKGYEIKYLTPNGEILRDTVSSERNHTPSISAEGMITIWVRAIDNVENRGVWSDPIHYYYDISGPEILFGGLRYIINSTTVDTSNTNTNDNTPIIFFTASDTLGTVVEASVNGYSATYDGTYWVAEITNPLPEGINSLSIKAKDNAGNESEITYAIFVDTKAPFAQYTYYKDGEEILSSTAYVQEVSQLSFLGQYMDDGPSSGILKDSYVIFDSNLLGTARTSKAYCGWRGTGNTVEIPYTEKVLFTNCEPTLPDGQYFMYHQVYDNAVRKDIPTITQFRDVKGLHFVVDTIAPVVEITSPLENDSLSGEVIIQGNVKDQNLSHYNISIYDGDADVNDFSKRLLQNTEYTTEFDTKNLLTWDTTEFDNGEYQIRLAARDLAGNRDDDTSIRVIKVIVDNTPPTTEQPTQNEGEIQGVTTGSNTTTNSPTLAKKVTTFIADILGVGGEGDVLALEEEEETLEDDEEVKGSQTCDNPSTISGYIYIDSNENGEKDEKERVFPEISIRIYTITEGMEETVKQIVSDENGYWETTLCSGDYYISVDDSKLPNNYVLEEDTLGVQVEEDKDSTLNFEVLDERNFLQKYWPWILLAVGILGSIGIVAVDTRRKKEYI